ncbi:chemotaxis protein CheA [Sphingomonas turrisvirgatae]|uniref:Chemotaxis protein CheA n=1 Tax=Sphingomonas turrisvirgatae TaxID=1888892 RepID=A0A1E3LUK6_9SPHN|nr:chemotaxis protein CheA [Sphingomonas turrisvirgatae]ODP36855.1 chemotaxis protein CheA [Sphingomonas turrisvirgatae]
MDDLLQEFIAETRETLEALSGEIVAWEANPADRARLDAIFRFVHTVKGSCGFLDLPRLARLSHAAEDVLAAVREGKRTPDRGLVNAVLAVVDRVGEIVEAIDAGSALDDTGEDLLIAALAEGSDEVATGASSAVQRAPTRSVRLNVDLLDRMMSGMSDMVLARNELSRRLRGAEVDPTIEAALERMSATVADLRDTVTRTRMQKIDALFSALPRMVRDTAAGLGKSVTLHVEGAEVELDREMIEVLRDPLVHIVRNSIDHGIEDPTARRAAGKRENGRLTVSARQSGNQIIVEVADDGRGIDSERLVRKAIEAGRDERMLRSLSERQKLQLVFEPGLSSKDEVTEISGRGVGMDVVRAAIEQIGGRVELDSAPGRGLRIQIHVPLTLSIIPTIVVAAGGQRFAVPRQAIEEIVSERSEAIRIDHLGMAEIATVRERRLPLVTLASQLEIGTTSSGDTMLAIVNVGEGSYALRVEDVLDNEELVIKPAAPAVMATGLYAGQTLPDSGSPMLLLDCAGIARDAGLNFVREAIVDEDEDQAGGESGITALVFGDLDGVRRAVPLALLDRIEQVEADAIRFAAGRLRLTIDGRIVPLVARGDLNGRGVCSILRLKDGSTEIAYAIAEAADIVTLPHDVIHAETPGAVAAVVLVDDEPVELVDAHWLFATHAHGDADSAAEQRPLCLLSCDEAGWMRNFVQPMLEGAGYRVADRPEPGMLPDVVLTLDDDPATLPDAAPLVRLSSRRGPGEDGSIYRYDRVSLLQAVAGAARRK